MTNEEQEEVKQYIDCPFCGDDGFDKAGLKNHLINSCEEYQNTEEWEMLMQ